MQTAVVPVQPKEPSVSVPTVPRLFASVADFDQQFSASLCLNELFKTKNNKKQRNICVAQKQKTFKIS